MVEMTGLQVVANQGWIIPYVACMLVLFGMLSHFGGVFLRFASRYERGAIPTAELIEGRRAEKSTAAIHRLRGRWGRGQLDSDVRCS